jgi:hypothetical protein
MCLVSSVHQHSGSETSSDITKSSWAASQEFAQDVVKSRGLVGRASCSGRQLSLLKIMRTVFAVFFWLNTNRVYGKLTQFPCTVAYFRLRLRYVWPPLWSSGQSSCLQIQRALVLFPELPDFLRNGVHSASWVQLRSYLEEKVAAPVEKTENTALRIRCGDHTTPSILNSLH